MHCTSRKRSCSKKQGSFKEFVHITTWFRTLRVAYGAERHASVDTKSTFQYHKFDFAAAKIHLEVHISCRTHTIKP